MVQNSENTMYLYRQCGAMLFKLFDEIAPLFAQWTCTSKAKVGSESHS